MADARARRRAQRETAKALREHRRVIPESYSRRARAVREQYVREQQTGGGGGGGGRSITELRRQVKSRKESVFMSVKWRARGSERAVDDSAEFEAMEEFLEMTDDQAYERAEAAARAVRARDMGLDYDEYDFSFAFLFYH